MVFVMYGIDRRIRRFLIHLTFMISCQLHEILNACSCFFGYMQLKPEEVAGIVGDFADPGTLAPTGLYIGGTKYMVIQGEPGAVIRGKKVINCNSTVL